MTRKIDFICPYISFTCKHLFVFFGEVFFVMLWFHNGNDEQPFSLRYPIELR